MGAVDCMVVGAGVVGLAVARALALAGREVIVVDAEDRIGSGVSARNSEVIHAGIYYPPGSLKALTCVEGKQRLYAYCAVRGVPHRRCGKLIVAENEAQVPALEALAVRAATCGVDDLVLLETADARAMEPALRCAAALWSPSTGIVDAHGYMLALQGEAETHGVITALNNSVAALLPVRDGLGVVLAGETASSLTARVVVNAAALGAQALARTVPGVSDAAVPRLHLAKGNYFGLAGRAPFDRLIYPMPQNGGLGIHLTLDLAGQARFGPDVEWVDAPAYDIDPRRSDVFYGAIRRYWPDLPDDSLLPAYAGIRPKLSGPGEAAADFVVSGPDDHGVAGLINLFGIESPGLTASLALADHVAAIVAISS